MSQKEIDNYLANLDDPKRTTLQQLRQTIESIIPNAEPRPYISYGMPAFRLQGKVIAADSPPSKTASVTCLTVVPYSQT